MCWMRPHARARPVPQLAQQGDELTLAQAYRVQAQLLRLRASAR